MPDTPHEQFTVLWERVSEIHPHTSPLIPAIREPVEQALADVIEGDGFGTLWAIERRIAHKVEMLPGVRGCLWRVDGEWYVTNADLLFWADVCFFGARDLLDEDLDGFELVANAITKDLGAKRRWQAWESYQAGGGLCHEHIRLLRNLAFRVAYDRGDWVSLYVDGKMPFGSDPEGDMAEILGRPHPNPETKVGRKRAEQLWELFDELPFALPDLLDAAQMPGAPE